MSKKQKAIIIGGGIAGKLAARVLSDCFEEVLVLERDSKSVGPVPRKGARQGEHLHALLHAGQYGLEELFPGITKKFYDSGAIKINSTTDLSWLHHGVWKLRYDGGYTTTLQTRPHLEWHIEQYMEQIPNVTCCYQAKVKNFLFHEEENRVYGVEIQKAGQSTRMITADLIVDTSGASSMTSTWLEKRGIAVPHQKVDIGLSYVSQTFQLPDDPDRDWKIKMIYPNPPYEKIGGTISKIEGNRYIVTVMGYLHAISEKEGTKSAKSLLELVKRLPALDIYHELQDAIPLTKVSTFRVPQIKWKRIDQVKSFPDGLLLMGDTVCRIDPVFGQGMSIAVVEALTLKKTLGELNGSLQQAITAFHRKIARVIAPVWQMVITEDFRYPDITGKRSPFLKTQQWYAKQVYLLSSKNEHIYDTFVKVMNLVQPINSLMQPRILMSVLKRALFK
ncbi:NAD(P)/FAD-dependent oxidoreductase [Bacillus thermotolerans]|uniref:FAD-binding domain-containing protein n=1 Tax=Bacillus thermotolerans TaxID=1221996 RepID=A0A0F5I4E4_BACTR|nr:FAD-dependent monooxygenase [Bacillus thermotolerans]KKB40348.1 hypothetical protein QY95_01731 [Bacillus thermotolerans]